MNTFQICKTVQVTGCNR